MSENGLKASAQKMKDAAVPEAAIRVFEHNYRQIVSGATGIIAEDSIEPFLDPPMLADVTIDPDQAQAALDKTVTIKLNGGLGTSMGLDRAKSLLPVRDGKNFLDLIVQQVLSARQTYGVRLPLLFMNSFRTEADTAEYLKKYPELPVGDLPLSFIQNRSPKLRSDDLFPVSWPADPSLEWCPPGHGDLYTSLYSTGILKKLVEQGYQYACVSNGDNLGAAPNPNLAGWFAQSGAPYAAEVCRRTVNDRKGGHLAVRKTDGQLILRDTAQTSAEEMHFFTDEFRHPFFHSNNLWFDLKVLLETLTKKDGVLGLPLIRNEKTVDPTDSSSTPVIQIETAMGAAIEVFPGATAICVDRDRFLPVKTTNELLLLRSDVYDLAADGQLIKMTEQTPEVDLTSKYYKTIAEFDDRIPTAPSLRDAELLKVQGDWSFAPDTRVIGKVVLGPEGGIASGNLS